MPCNISTCEVAVLLATVLMISMASNAPRVEAGVSSCSHVHYSRKTETSHLVRHLTHLPSLYESSVWLLQRCSLRLQGLLCSLLLTQHLQLHCDLGNPHVMSTWVPTWLIWWNLHCCGNTIVHVDASLSEQHDRVTARRTASAVLSTPI